MYRSRPAGREPHPGRKLRLRIALGSVQLRLRESLCLTEVRALQLRAAEVRALQLRAVEFGALQLRAVEPRPLEVGVMQVQERWRLAQPFLPAAEDGPGARTPPGDPI